MNRIYSLLILLFIFTPTKLLAQDIPAELREVSKDIQQAVLVYGTTDSISAKVSGWERKDGVWKQALKPVKAVVGRNGLAPEGEKREGDGRTPTGTFDLRRAFGYQGKVQTGLDYNVVTEKDFWIDDIKSPFYNQWITQDIAPDVSHEVLRRTDDLYKYAIVVEYNTDPIVQGMGSAIFMHIWRGPTQPTAGCIAMSENNIVALLSWLDIRRSPVIIIKN